VNLPEKIYTEKDVQRAKTKGKLVGWLQGGGIVLVGAVVWNMLGWIPIVVGGAAVTWVIYKFMTRGSKDADVEVEVEVVE
jgi:hypothetical protein